MKTENSENTKIKNVFVLCPGRCGSKTFVKACEYIKNYSSGHESRVSKLGDDRLNYPLYHIEADNRLSWFLGRLDNKYRDSVVYVHLHRDPKKIAKSYNLRWPYRRTIVRAFANGILLSDELSINTCVDYVRTVSENITYFLRDKSRVFHVDIDSPRDSFSEFWDYIGAEGDKAAALKEFDVVHNPSLSDVDDSDAEGAAGDTVASLERVITLSYEERKQAFSLLSKKDTQLNEKIAELIQLELKIANDEKVIEELKQRSESIGLLQQQVDELESSLEDLSHQLSVKQQHIISRESAISELNVTIMALDEFNSKLYIDHSQLISEFNKSRVLAEKLKGSRSYRLGNSLVKNLKSPLRWFRVPIDLLRSMKVKKIDEAVALVMPAKHRPSSVVAALDSFVKEKPNKLILRASEIAKKSIEDAAELIELKGTQRDMLSFNILWANNSLTRGSGDAEWLRYVNNYLSQFRISPLELNQRKGSLFSRLESHPEYIVDDPTIVSVIMPAFNAVDSIRKAAESILNQTWKGIQLIIIDDQSDDGTWDVIQTLASEDSRVIALHNSINVGPYVSKNKALKLVEGKYITGHDADDWSHPQRIENQLRELRIQKNARAGISYMLRTTPEGSVTQFTSIGRLSYDGVARVSSISCIFETEFFKQRLGAWDSVRFGADSEIIERTRVILGDDLCDQQLITMICQDIEGSLTNDPKTGVRVEGHGLSPVRKAYKEAWSEWHKQLSLDDSLDSALGLSVADRQFLAPEEMQVADKDLDVIYSN